VAWGKTYDEKINHRSAQLVRIESQTLCSKKS
jgi:hypothetical protein